MRTRKTQLRWLTALAVASALCAPALASAQTLEEALAAAYENNPTITAARSGQRALDEGVPIARADGRPSVNADASYSEQPVSASNSPFTPDRIASLRAQVTVPLYAGGSVRNAIRAAETRVEGGQADLRGTESAIFSQVVGAYMDVLRDEAVVALNRNSVEVLTVNLTATRDRFDIGDLTRTDVAQSEARLALARAQLQSAEARLIGSREQFIRLVGVAPTNLSAPPALTGLPASVELAVETALAENPDIEAAQTAIAASRYDVRALQGARLPRVALTGSGSVVDYLDRNFSSIAGPSLGAGVSVSVPLYAGGEPAARVRQAQARSSQALETAVAVERGVIAQVRAAYASWRASLSVVESSRIAVEAGQLSLEGTRAENSVGTRTILDILNAEQELVNAQVQLVTAQRDAYVAAFTLLAAMGRAEAEDLGIGGSMPYDPQANADRVAGRWSDWNDDPAPATVATRTVTVPAQTSTVPRTGPLVPARPPR